MDEVDQIKERLNIEEVVSSYLTLKRAGTNLKGSCPFHNEKTPSFMVNPERQIFKCFGCGEGGDVFTFIEKIEGVDFYNALKILADKAGVTLKSRSVSRGKQEYKADHKTTLYDINDLAARVYHKILQDHPKAKNARDYLKLRGVSQAAIEKFQIGYAPNSWDFLIRFMESKKYKRSELEKAGLAVANSKGDYYDRFRGRIIFPIGNIMGNVIGFTSRILVDDGKQAKYINSAESAIYHKGKVLYGLDKAKLAIRKEQVAVIVEGNMDVIACHQAGFENVVASSGTAITEEQIKMLSRYAPTIAFAFDSDAAGVSAMKKAVTMASGLDITAKIIKIPEGFKDPDEVLKKDKKIWQRAVSEAKPAIIAWIDLLCRESDVSDIAQRKKIAKEILPVIKNGGLEIEKEHYIKYLAKKLSTSEASLIKDLASQKSLEPENESKSERFAGAIIDNERRILAIIYTFPEIAQEGLKLSEESLQDEKLRSLWQKMFKNELRPEKLNYEEKNLLDQWSYQISLDFEGSSPEHIKDELRFLIARKSQDKNSHLKEKYARLIKQAQDEGDKNKLKELLAEFSRLIQS